MLDSRLFGQASIVASFRIHVLAALLILLLVPLLLLLRTRMSAQGGAHTW